MTYSAAHLNLVKGIFCVILEVNIPFLPLRLGYPSSESSTLR